ncbi:hypothetical protein QFC19_008145 [Naganishia cerealis]|uniref:Uncharacterized protein n=1 Tax=Naganishia cerealis TaxID=610337 RepID=A0ACC2V485_9TREE|nr:hypothetical protein QFC19_008145 [Naganishia cerealis]
MSTFNDAPTFQFLPGISLDEFRKLWQKAFEEAKSKLTDLERDWNDNELDRYLEDLNAFDQLTGCSDVTGNVWKYMQPDEEFRKEGAAARKAFTALRSKVNTSASIAENLSRWETLGVSVGDDTKRFFEEWKRNLRRGGAYLAPDKRQKVRDLTTKIQDTADEYTDNIRDDNSTLKLHLEELRGVPEDYLSSHPADPDSREITLRYKGADTSPVLEYCQVQATREKVFKFHWGTSSNVNGPVLQRLLDLRSQKAEILGYRNWAEYQAETSMVKSAPNAASFLDDVYEAIRPRAESEKKQIGQLLKEKDGIEVQSWDLKYGEALLKSQLLRDFDLKSTRQYFQVSRVFPALLRIVEKLFSLRFENIESLTAWHPSVTACHVYDLCNTKEKLIGKLFFDLFPREAKMDGASAWCIRAPIPERQLAEVILKANIPEQPAACMSYLEVRTLLHELGHCVHNMVAPNRYAQFAGIGACQRDFAEAPSQMLELWLTDYKLFDFAINNKGEVIPQHVLTQLVAADEVGRAICAQRQLVLARYSLELHTKRLESEDAIYQLVASTYQQYGPFPVTRETSSHLTFWHLALPAYASGYYAYLFAEVICHDLFREFQKSGNIMDIDVATRYRRVILERVGSQDADEVVTAFLGRKYSSEAYKNWLNAGAPC